MKHVSKAVAGLALAAIAGCSSSASPNAVQTFAQPENAAQVARQIGATDFADHGPAPLGGVQDGGTAMYQGRKIGIDTFADASVRNTWLTSAAQLGVSPLLEGANWVAYWSVTSTA